MKPVYSFLRRYGETILVILTVVVMTTANSWHIISRFFSRPENTTFIGITHYHEDYFYYLSQVTQGAEGAWRVSNLYTAEAIPPQTLWWPNILLGKISAVTSLPPWTIFSFAVTVTAALSLTAFYWVSRLLYPADRGKRLGTFLLSALTTTFYFVSGNPDGGFSIIPHQFFYNYTASLNRLGGVFHLILQNVFSVIMIVKGAVIYEYIFYAKHTSKLFTKALIITSISSFLLMFINPVYILTNGVTFIVTALVLLVSKPPKLTQITKLAASGLIIGLPLVIPYLSMQLALREPYFQYFRWWETNVKRVTPEEFFLSLGPIVILAIIGLVPFVRKGSVLRLMGVIWTVFPLTIYFTWIPIKLQFPFFRLPQPPHYIFWAALAVEALTLPSLILGKMGKRTAAKWLFFILIFFWCLVQLPAIRIEVRNRNQSHALESWLNYMPEGVIGAMTYLKNSPDQRLVLAINNVELVVPALSGRTVYVGHHSLTLNYPEKIAAASRFFIGAMTSEEGLTFLKANNIGFVLWRKPDGPKEKLLMRYPFLSVAYENTDMTVFSVPL